VENVYIFLQQIYSGNCITKFHQNRPSFVEDITKTFWSLFSGHCKSDRCAVCMASTF